MGDQQTTNSVYSLSNLFKTRLLADVHFVLKSKCGPYKQLSAHKNVLASGSPVFERMFCSEMSEDNIIRIVDASAEAFGEFLQMFYMDNCSFKESNIAEVLRLIDKYDVPKCIGMIETFLMQTLQKDNVFLYFELTLSFGLSQHLLDKCEQIFCDSTEVIFQSPNFLSLNKIAVIKMLDLDELKCDEMAIFDAAISWAKRSLHTRGLDPSNDNIRDELQDMIHCIRFPIMSTPRFLTILERYPNLLDAPIYLDILSFIASKRMLTNAKHFKTKHRFLTKSFYEFNHGTEVTDFSFAHTIQLLPRSSGNLSPYSATSKMGFTLNKIITNGNIDDRVDNESILLTAFDAVLPLPIRSGRDMTVYKCKITIDNESSECETILRSVKSTRRDLELMCRLKSPFSIVCCGIYRNLEVEMMADGTFRPEHSLVIVPAGNMHKNGWTFTNHDMRNNKFITKLYFTQSKV